jgi:hypothetical protein
VTAYFDGGVLKYAAIWRAVPDTTVSMVRGTSPTFTFSANDPLATFECRLDAGAWAACTSPKSLGRVSVGQHTFAVRAVDRNRRADSTPATKTFSV